MATIDEGFRVRDRNWTHKWVYADGKYAVAPYDETHHPYLMMDLGYDDLHGQPENYIGGLYDAGNGELSHHGYWGRPPTEEEIKAELEARTLPDHTGSYFLETIASEDDYWDSNPDWEPSDSDFNQAFLYTGDNIYPDEFHYYLIKEHPDEWQNGVLGWINNHKKLYLPQSMEYDTKANPELYRRLHELMRGNGYDMARDVDELTGRERWSKEHIAGFKFQPKDWDYESARPLGS